MKSAKTLRPRDGVQRERARRGGLRDPATRARPLELVVQSAIIESSRGNVVVPACRTHTPHRGGRRP